MTKTAIATPDQPRGNQPRINRRLTEFAIAALREITHRWARKRILVAVRIDLTSRIAPQRGRPEFFVSSTFRRLCIAGVRVFTSPNQLVLTTYSRGVEDRSSRLKASAGPTWR
jgi:hypothetical protein